MLEFRLLGSLKLQGPEGEQVLSVLSQPKRVALLSYLAVAKPRGFHRRDKLVNLFWPDLDQDRARAALRKSLHHLRRSLGEEAVLSRGDEEVGLGSDSIRCDVVDFEEAVEGRPEEAMDLYRGHLLEGFHLAGCQEFQRWLDDERERLKELAAGAAWELAYRFASAGLLADGERMGQRALALAPTDEAQVRRFVEALAKAGGRAAAVAFYERFARLLEEELELRPDAESRDLAERIRDSRVLQTPIEGDASGVEPRDGSLGPTIPDPASRAQANAAGSDTALDSFRAAIADRYQIEREIGKGGMAAVYLAQDLRHERKVAVKVLKPELAAVMGAERFLAEIRTTANLSHPHILPLHDSGEADGFLFYVMPFVEGESLGQKLKRDGQLPIEEAVRIAGHVADALDYAHRKGVIHRDIKPGNILFQAGDPVVTDFGIALAISAAGEGRITETGLSLGTPYYMSPEQAAGDQTPTAASDVYSLGCVLYEMLTGDPPHTGASTQAILGRILFAEVTRPTMLRRTIPANVEGAVLKALERLPADRFESVADLSAALRDEDFRYGVPPPGLASTRGLWMPVAMGLGALTVLSLAAGLAGVLGPGPEPAPTVRNSINLTTAPLVEYSVSMIQATLFAEGEVSAGLAMAISPDGSAVVFPDTLGAAPGTFRLFLKTRDMVEARPIPGTDLAWVPRFSPEGDRIAYQVGTDLVIQSLQGGSSITLVEDLPDRVSALNAIDWLPDGTILYEQEGSTLVRIPDDRVAPPDTIFVFSTLGPAGQIAYVHGLPGGDAALAITCENMNCPRADLSVVDLVADTAWVIREDVVRAWYVPTGHVVFVRRDGAVFGAPFDRKTLELGEDVTPLFGGVQTGPAWADMVLSEDGTALFVQRASSGEDGVVPMWVDREGLAEPVDSSMEPASYWDPDLSPDDQKLALSIYSEETSQTEEASHIWVKELPEGPLVGLTSGEDRYDEKPVWSVDGRTIAFTAVEGGDTLARRIRSDGSDMGRSELLLDRDRQVREVEYTPDGDGIVFREGHIGRNADLGYLDLRTDSVHGGLLASKFDEWAVTLSPDGHWMAYVSNVTGRDEVYVRPFPHVAASQTQVSRTGGLEPVWAHNGRELFYRDSSTGWLTAASYLADSDFVVEERKPLFDATRYRSWAGWRAYDVTTDDQRFLMMSPVISDGEESKPGSSLIQILNWFTELEERLGGEL